MKDKIKFEKHIQKSSFYNPMMGNQLDSQEMEIRTDPLTGFQSVFNPRLEDKAAIFFGASDYTLIERLASESESRCFLCEDKWKQMTPKYHENLLPAGRIQTGEAVLFPNIFPLAQIHAVIRVGADHYLPLKKFKSILIHDAFQTSKEFSEALLKTDIDVNYFTVNGNYLGPAGASIAHPHFQILGGDLPFTYLAQLLHLSNQYTKEKNSCYWEDLIKVEKNINERYIGQTGSVDWIAPFSPQGTNEVLGITNKQNILEFNNEDINGLADGFSRTLKGYDKMGHSTFNFSLYSGPLNKKDQSFRSIIRIISRQNVYENYRTDDYFMQKLLRNEVILTSPEMLASNIWK